MLLRLEWLRKSRGNVARWNGASRRVRYKSAIERLEDRALLSASWNQLNGNAQHTGDTAAVAQPLDQVLWSVPLDLEPWGAVHYGDPIFTPNNTVIIPIKVTWSAQNQNAQNFFIEALNDVTGQVLWTSAPTGTITGASDASPIVITSANNGLVTGDSVTIGGVLGNKAANGTFTITTLNQNQFELNGTTGNGTYTSGGTWVSNTGDASYIEPTYNWIPPLQPVYDPVTNRVYFPGPGGTLDYIANPDTPGTPTVVQEAFYGLSNYTANESAYNSSIYINTGLTVDSSGNVYFGFTETGSNPSGINDGGVVRISPTGAATYTLAYSAVGQTNDGNWNPAMGASPSISNDGSIVYFGINDSGYSLSGSGEYNSYLVGLNSTTLAPEYSVHLLDPTSGDGAGLIDESTSGPMVAPDGTVFQGVFGNPYNGSRGYLLHFSGNLETEYTPGAFGWDDTPSIVPTSMVPSYTGSSSYLILCKFNDYANADFGGPNSGYYGGNGVNEIAVLDPYSSVPDPNYDPNNPNPGYPNPNFDVMATVEAFASPSPDLNAISAGDPDAVREWCTNGTVVDPATNSVFMNNEDGYTYEWNLATNTITNAVEITTGIGVPYTPTAIAPNGEIFSDNGGTLFAEGGYANYTITTTSSADPAVVGNSITFTTTLASTDAGPTPTGSVTFSYTEGASNPFNSTPITIQTVPVVNGVASVTVSGWAAAHYHVVASYSGDSNYSAGQSTLVQPVLETATTTITSSANPVDANTSVTFTATVAPNGSSFVPIGTVTFYEGSTELGTAYLNNLDNEANPASDNTATFSTAGLAGGDDAITAVYSGDLNFTGDTSTVFYEYIPVVTNPGTQNNAVGDSVSLQVQANGLPPGDAWTFSATGLPSGLSINSSTGQITGTITGAAGSYTASVTAADGTKASAGQSFTWNVSSLSETNPGTQTNAVGDSPSLHIQAGGLPSGDSWTYSATGLPSGLSINASTGLISGTITGSAEDYSASVTAGDGHGASATQTFSWDVFLRPGINAPSSASLTENTELTFSSANGNEITVTDGSAGSNDDWLTISVSDGTVTLGSTTGLSFSGGTNGSSSFTAIGTIGNLNAGLNGITYQPNVNYVGSDTLAMSLTDPTDGFSGSANVALTVNTVGPPSISAPSSASVSENGTLVFSTANGNLISVTDNGTGGNTDTATLSVTHGTLTLGSTNGLIFLSGSNDSASMSFKAAVSNLNNALSGLTYQPTSGYAGSDSLAISIVDPTDGKSASGSVAITVSPFAPSITAPSSASLNEDGSLAFSSANGNGISVTDSNPGAVDSLSLSVLHGTLTLSTTSGLTFTSGSNGSASFTVSGTVSNLNTALNGVTYQPTSGYSGFDTLAISITDPGDNESASKNVALTINGLAAPSVTAPASATVLEDATLTFSAAGGNAITITDAGAGSGSDSLTLTVTHGTLTLSTTSGLTFTSGANGSASLTASGTVANLNAALNGLTYKPTTGYTGSDSLAISVTDPGDNKSGSGSVAITVNAFSPPSISAPGSATVTVNGSLVFSSSNGNAITVADSGPGSGSDSLTLTVSHGTVTLSTTSGLTITGGANGSATITVTGSIANLNSALSGLTYKPTSGYTGSDSLAISIKDSADSLSASASVALNVVNSPPAISAPSTASVAIGSSLVFSSADNDAITISDVSAGSSVEPLSLTATDGTLTLGSTTGITFTSGSNNSASMTIDGTLANLNNALSGLAFTPAKVGNATVVLSYTDVGNGLMASATINISVKTGVTKLEIGSPAAAPASQVSGPTGGGATPAASPTVGTEADDDSSMPPDSLTQWRGLAAAVELLGG